MTTAQKAYWRDNMLKLALLLFGAGVAWGAVQFSQAALHERLEDDGLILRDHEERITDLEVCAAEQAVTSAAILEQMRQLNENVQSINEFLRDMGSRAMGGQ
jgi:uncharacterized coiled-coil protein SlyX